MLMNGSFHMFFRQAAAKMSSHVIVIVETLHKRGGSRQTPLCATVLRLRGHELSVSGSSHASSARHHEKVTTSFPIECPKSG